MSGVGEAIAIVSCVAALIQAYDAGSRTLQSIRDRRKAHGALPPSNLLEESLEKGKREIEVVVSDGNKRFGPDFEEGDGEYPIVHIGSLLTSCSYCATRTPPYHSSYSKCLTQMPGQGSK
jgi:hypothetical protein